MGRGHPHNLCKLLQNDNLSPFYAKKLLRKLLQPFPALAVRRLRSLPLNPLHTNAKSCQPCHFQIKKLDRPILHECSCYSAGMDAIIDERAGDDCLRLCCAVKPASADPREWDTHLPIVGGGLMRGRHGFRFREFRRSVVPLRLALDVKRARTNDQAHNGNLTAQELAVLAAQDQSSLISGGEALHAHRPPRPPSPHGHVIADLCLTPRILGQRPQARLRARAGAIALI
ncbi:hypothetical protein GALL_378550 [mine drainage metagenome]|uniref:Uncharacterized protein n=1 Tax=mine drainage metagenome TaxID=410659 RepID=A0A1J5QWY2_9ZZZZ